MSIELFDLTGKVALVVGASRGIGCAIATGLQYAGAETVGCGRSENNQKVSELYKFKYEQCDIMDIKKFDKLCATLKNIDILVYAVGITIPMKFDSSVYDKINTFNTTIDTNLCSAYSAILISLKYMTRGSSVINITSIGGSFGFPNNPSYVSSKGGLKMLTKALAVDYGKDGIRFNNIAPGYIHTSMTEKSFNDDIKYKNRKNHTCLDRWGIPEDLVGAAIFLASDASKYVTGIDLYVDGGWTAKGMVGE